MKKNHNKIHRKSAWRRDGNKCLKCGSIIDLTVDHIVPRAILKRFKIQSLGYKNWQVLCYSCNFDKSESIISYRKDRGRLSSILLFQKLTNTY